MLLVSFGFRHDPPPSGPPTIPRVVIDVRHRLEDPAGFQAIRALLDQAPDPEKVNGLDRRVRAVVMADPAAPTLLKELVDHVLTVTPLPDAELWVGCSQGHDRSVALVEEVAARARIAGRTVTAAHRDVHQERLRP